MKYLARSPLCAAPVLASFAAVLLATPCLHAQVPYLVKDIVPGSGSSSPFQFRDWGGSLVFTATTSDAGREPWISDGTEAGTRMILDIRPGPDSSITNTPQWFFDTLSFNGFHYFRADDGVHGAELWRSDGTPAGTTFVFEFEPGAAGTDYNWSWCVSGGAVYLAVNTPTLGRELWKSDGTPSGTFLLADIHPGAASGVDRILAPHQGGVVFSADDGVHGRELWWTDGTTSGTQMVADIQPGPGSALEGYGREYAGMVLFVADDGVHGQELWRTDGTSAGTWMVADVEPGPGSAASPITFLDLRHCEVTAGVLLRLFTTAFGEEPWVTDGTGAGTRLLVDINPNTETTNQLIFGLPNGRATILAYSPGTGREPWVTDGTPANTQIVEIHPGPANSPQGYSIGNLVADGKAYFTSFTASTGVEPAVSDGTVLGTHLVKEVVPGIGNGVGHFTAAGDLMLFRGPQTYYTNGDAQWTHPVPLEESGLHLTQGLGDALLVGTRLFLAPDYTSSSFGGELWAVALDADGDGTIAYFDALNLELSCTCPASLAPCGNADAGAGCGNSSGSGARLDGTGSTVLSLDDLVLTITHLPPSQVGLLFMGTTHIAPLPFQDGLRCASGSTTRWPAKFSDPSGKVTYGPGLASQAQTSLPPGFQFVAGADWTVQYWYRDPNGPCGSHSNLSSAATLIFTP